MRKIGFHFVNSRYYFHWCISCTLVNTDACLNRLNFTFEFTNKIMTMLEQLFTFPALPEITLLATISIVLLLELFVPQKQGLISYCAAQCSLIITLCMVLRVPVFP